MKRSEASVITNAALVTGGAVLLLLVISWIASTLIGTGNPILVIVGLVLALYELRLAWTMLKAMILGVRDGLRG